MAENRKPIPDFDGYEITSDGEVWSHKTGRFIKSFPDKAGYLGLTLRREGRSVRRTIHQLVVESFVGPRPVGFELVRHLNGDHTDNRVENLAYGTFRENSLDTIRHGNHRKSKSNAKLTVLQVSEIRSLIQEGGMRQSDIGLLYGVSNCAISRIKTGFTWSEAKSDAD